MQVEVQYPVGTEVWMRGKIKGVEVNQDGILYRVVVLHNDWDSVKVKADAIVLVVPSANGT